MPTNLTAPQNAIVARLRFWCQHVLPAVYDDSLSYYELLCKIVDKVNEVIESNNELAGYVADNKEAIAELQKLFKEFKEHGFDDYYKEQVIKWIKDNISLIYNELTTQVFFGLTSDGHFCAYIPDSWAEIEFDTGAIYGTESYGRLILRYDANGTGVINNTAYDWKVLDRTIDAKLANSAGDGLRYDTTDKHFDVNVGDGLKIDSLNNIAIKQNTLN